MVALLFLSFSFVGFVLQLNKKKFEDENEMKKGREKWWEWKLSLRSDAKRKKKWAILSFHIYFYFFEKWGRYEEKNGKCV